MSFSVGLLKKLREDQLSTMIEEFKDELKDFKNILNKIKKLELLREQEINELKNERKRKLNMLDDEISDILEQLDVDSKTLELRCSFCEKPHNFKKENQGKRKRIKIISKRKKKEIERLKEEVKNYKDELLDRLLDGEAKIYKLLTDLEYEKNDVLHDITVLESKLIKLGITSLQIGKTKESVLSS